ncbi:MAG: hypothetical protein WCK49_08600 [Myxococcaceae bacterium]
MNYKKKKLNQEVVIHLEDKFYEGERKNGLEHGFGTATWGSNLTYEGEWRSGLIKGWGIFTLENGHRYAGYWEYDSQGLRKITEKMEVVPHLLQ